MNVDQSAMCYILGMSLQAVQTSGKIFSNSFSNYVMAENRKLFKWIVWHEYWSKCNVLNVKDSSQQAL